ETAGCRTARPVVWEGARCKPALYPIDFSKILGGAFGPGILAEVTAAQQGQEISDFLWDLIRNE
ncbi:hypothetical protein, partial [Sutterella wadsworthensis]|uniref:hypothetical protein n=1 Tax=Sutterella wadsworthensis TaxID=40545 RepID=UPI0019D04372